MSIFMIFYFNFVTRLRIIFTGAVPNVYNAIIRRTKAVDDQFLLHQ